MKVAIVHYLPLEYYPPIINFLNILRDNYKSWNVHVYTTKNNKNRKEYTNSYAHIRRYTSIKSENQFFRLLKYMWFNVGTLISLLILKPSKIIYYETYSSYPVYLYKRFMNKKVGIYIHNHEYFEPEWYKKGMRLLAIYHKKECNYLYPQAVWNSQTNEKRAELFLKDNPNINPSTIKVVPNYPPLSWKRQEENKVKQNIIKFVYIGSLSLESTYIKEFCKWIDNKENMSFDIYSFNLTHVTKEYLNSIQSSNIHFFEKGVEYNDIPNVLTQYDIGLIFYRVKTFNVKYCAPNKLFEYLTCGLDVWCSTKMEGCYQYITKSTYPKVMMLDFEELDKINCQELTSKKGLVYQPVTYYAEEAYEELFNHLQLH